MRIYELNCPYCGGQCVEQQLSTKAFAHFSNRIIIGPPSWHDGNRLVDSEHEIPMLPFVSDDDLPSTTMAFDKVRRGDDISRQLFDFYVSDAKLRTILNRPDQFLMRFRSAWGITSPDISIWRDSPMFARIGATWYNRAIGCYFSDRGLRVVPQVRWSSARDYTHCFAGVAPGSVVAVSNNGCWRDVELRQSFLHGIGELQDRLSPSTIIIYGRLDNHIRQRVGSGTNILHFPSHQTAALVAA